MPARKMVLLPPLWGGVGGQHNSLVPFVEQAWVVSDRKATRLILTVCRGATWELESPDRHIPALGVRGDEESMMHFCPAERQN